MTIWFRRGGGLNSKTMREIATKAGVSWDAESIIYQSQGIGFADGDPNDASALQDVAETIVGYRPREYQPPEPLGLNP